MLDMTNPIRAGYVPVITINRHCSEIDTINSIIHKNLTVYLLIWDIVSKPFFIIHFEKSNSGVKLLKTIN